MSVLVREYIYDYPNLVQKDVVGTGRLIKMDVDRAVDVLYHRREFNDQQVQIFELMKRQHSPSEISEMLDISRERVVRIQEKLCRAIAAFLGTEYQDGKLIAQVSKRLERKLTEEELKVCWYIINRRGKYYDQRINIFNFYIDSAGIISATPEGDNAYNLS